MRELSYEGAATGIIYGFLKSLPAFQTLFNTSHMIFCWDSKTSKREEIFPKYKSNRKNRYKDLDEEEIKFENDFRYQMKKLRIKYLKMIGFRNIFCQKGYESDDIIASVCKGISPKDEAIIISSDKDLYQLIWFNVSFYNPQKNKMLTLQGFKKLYGIPPREWAMVKALAGCSTDEIPGLGGIGEKTAIKYLLGQLGEETRAYNIITSKAGIRIFKRNTILVYLPFKGTKSFTLKKDVLSEEGWDSVCEQLGMKSIKDKFPFGKQRR